MKLTERRILMLTVEPGRKDRLVFDDEQPKLAARGKSARPASRADEATLLSNRGTAGKSGYLLDRVR
jgi:hypothetical protein